MTTTADHLVTGDEMPTIIATALDGDRVDITASLAGEWAVILIYRGDW